MDEMNTNSPIGSQHWFNTLIGEMGRIGEYIKNHSEIKYYSEYGERIEGISKFLIENYKHIQNQNFVDFQKELNSLLFRYEQ